MRRTSPSKLKRDFQAPSVVFQPRVAEGMQNGFNKLVDLIRPTLGPLPHSVAIEKNYGRDQLPELLDSGGTIARRIIQIPNRQEDVGFMLLRQALWTQQEREGDGTATAAVLFQAVFNAGRHYLVAGGSALELRRHFENGLRLIIAELERQTTQLYGKQKLTGLAYSICSDDELAKMMGEIFDIIGAYGRLEVRQDSGHELVREYVEGMYWEGGLRSRDMANAQSGLRANLENAALLISDLEIESPEQLIPLLELAVKNEIKQLLLISSTLSDRAMGILLTKPNRVKVLVVAVKVPGISSNGQSDSMTDLAILTGGRALIKASGATIENVRLEDLGRARRVWVDKEFFGIVGGRGNARLIRQHIASLRQSYRNVKNTEDGTRLLERIGKLLGGSATLFIGGNSPTAIEARVELAKRTADAMRGAIRDGVVPGGGGALLACREVLRYHRMNANDTDELAAYSILLQALEVPFRTIVSNAGVWPGRILAEVDRCGPGYGYDVLTSKVVDLRKVGLYDAATVVKGAVHTAIASAALALTTDVIVHHRNPPEALNT
jgi:chaperonin GroEL